MAKKNKNITPTASKEEKRPPRYEDFLKPNPFVWPWMLRYLPSDARLRDVFERIENALQAGVTRSTVLRTLHENGFKMQPRSFESALYRLRKLQQKPIKIPSNKTVKIAGFEVPTTNRLNHKPNIENDLLK